MLRHILKPNNQFQLHSFNPHVVPSLSLFILVVGSLCWLVYIDDISFFQQVADGALRCFASLADRFTRRGVDPAPLAQHGLVEDLLHRLSQAGGVNANVQIVSSSAAGSGQSGSQGAVAGAAAAASASAGSDPTNRNSPSSVSTVISLLATLCRGSPDVTHSLLRSKLPSAIECAMQGDDRCVLDTIRLVDLLLVLLFEGRKALPKSGVGGVCSRIPGLRRMDSAGERSHRQLIDCIRHKDTDALIDAIDSGSKYN